MPPMEYPTAAITSAMTAAMARPEYSLRRHLGLCDSTGFTSLCSARLQLTV